MTDSDWSPYMTHLARQEIDRVKAALGPRYDTPESSYSVGQLAEKAAAELAAKPSTSETTATPSGLITKEQAMFDKFRDKWQAAGEALDRASAARARREAREAKRQVNDTAIVVANAATIAGNDANSAAGE